jgi:hypothetical protein
MAAGTAIMIWLFVSLSAAAGNTPSLGNGDCWRTGTPYTCIVTWSGKSKAVFFRAIDQFSSQRPAWYNDANTAVYNWNAFSGPQYYAWQAHSNDTWIYLNYSTDGQHGLCCGYLAITWLCDRGGSCEDSLSTPINIYWADVYLDHNNMDSQGDTVLTNVFAHESGHGMGLAHNTSDTNSVMNPNYHSAAGPDSNDGGTYPGCSSGGFGINCIYGWGD